MQSDGTTKSADSLKQWVNDLSCPVCFGALRFSESFVACTTCARTYPIVDGIPVLIPQRATPPAS